MVERTISIDLEHGHNTTGLLTSAEDCHAGRTPGLVLAPTRRSSPTRTPPGPNSLYPDNYVAESIKAGLTNLLGPLAAGTRDEVAQVLYNLVIILSL